MTYSKRHLTFSGQTSPTALTHPEKFIGRNWKNVLNVWKYLDTLSDYHIETINTICFRPYFHFEWWQLICNYSNEECNCTYDIYNLTPTGFDSLVIEIIAADKLAENQIPLKYLPNLCKFMTHFKPSMNGSNSLQPQ